MCSREERPFTCELVDMHNGRRAPDENSQVARLTRWVPDDPSDLCPFKYYTRKEGLSLLHGLNITRIVNIGDSQGRYFSLRLASILSDHAVWRRITKQSFLPLNYSSPGFDGVTVDFYWRVSVPEIMQGFKKDEYWCNFGDFMKHGVHRGRLIILNNFAHQVLHSYRSFKDPLTRLKELGDMVDQGMAECGDRSIFYRTPNELFAGRKFEVKAAKKHAADAHAYQGDALDLELEVIPKLKDQFHVPTLDAHSMTKMDKRLNMDGLHYQHWELDHEVHTFLSHIHCLGVGGYWKK